jgi:hypothetical protein
MSVDMHDTLRKLTALGVHVSLHPAPSRDGIEYTLSVSLDDLELETLKRVIDIVEKGNYRTKLRNGWLELYHLPDSY